MKKSKNQSRIKSKKLHASKTGLPPGALVHIGSEINEHTKISVIDYSKENLQEVMLNSADEILKYKENKSVTWLQVEGLSNIALIEKIGTIFNIHPLVLEDILNTHQRPKFEDYEDYLFVVLKCLTCSNKQFTVNDEQVSLIILENFVISFKEKSDDLFKSVEERIRTSKGRIRNLGSDYLTYAILDAVIDHNFLLIDTLDDVITDLEDDLINSEPTQKTLNSIQSLKREIISIKRYVNPIRELMAGLLRSESHLINEKTHIYFKDVADHSSRIIDSIELYREILIGLLDIYISSVSNKMNEVMKVLTVFASIFIPLTFIAGIYGMNFEYMPELKWKWAYPVLWGFFITISVSLLVYFKKKKWL